MNKFGDNSKSYPAEMRTQLWPLCCGAQIISGFKSVGTKSAAELAKQIEDVLAQNIPDHQVFAGETMQPGVQFLTLNGGQMASKTIMEAVKKAGFVQFGQGTDRTNSQGFFVRNQKGNFKLVEGCELKTVKSCSVIAA